MPSSFPVMFPAPMPTEDSAAITRAFSSRVLPPPPAQVTPAAPRSTGSQAPHLQSFLLPCAAVVLPQMRPLSLKLWPPIPPRRPSPLGPAQLLRAPSTAPALPPRGPHPLTYLLTALDTQLRTSPLLPTPQIPLSELLPSPSQALNEPTPHLLQGGMGVGRKSHQGRLALCEHPMASPGPSMLLAGLCSLPGSLCHLIQSTFHLLHAPQTSSSCRLPSSQQVTPSPTLQRKP